MMGSDGSLWLSGIGGMGGIGIILVMVFLVALVWWLVWGAGIRSQRRSASDKSPLEIMWRRYAAGEVGQLEYEQARKTLAPIDLVQLSVTTGISDDNPIALQPVERAI